MTSSDAENTETYKQSSFGSTDKIYASLHKRKSFSVIFLSARYDRVIFRMGQTYTVNALWSISRLKQNSVNYCISPNVDTRYNISYVTVSYII